MGGRLGRRGCRGIGICFLSRHWVPHSPRPTRCRALLYLRGRARFRNRILKKLSTFISQHLSTAFEAAAHNLLVILVLFRLFFLFLNGPVTPLLPLKVRAPQSFPLRWLPSFMPCGCPEDVTGLTTPLSLGAGLYLDALSLTISSSACWASVPACASCAINPPQPPSWSPVSDLSPAVQGRHLQGEG